MEETYLVEIRLARTRWQIKKTIQVIAKIFGVETNQERHPHITLYGPFTLDNPARVEDLLENIGSCASDIGPLSFMLDSWERRDGIHGSVVAFSVRASPELVRLTSIIGQGLSSFTISLNAWDQQPDKKWFHATIANRLPTIKAEEILHGLDAIYKNNSFTISSRSVAFRLSSLFISLATKAGILPQHKKISPVLLDDAGLRITVMHNEDILGEYDLLLKRWLSPEEIHDPLTWQKTMALYRQHAGFELKGQTIHDPGEIFLISDLHLGHVNIIRYCSRPFVPSDVAEMDSILIANWNYSVSDENYVYFLGDLRYGREARLASEYCELLNGKITFVSGNHDGTIKSAIPFIYLTYEEQEFLLLHDPTDAPASFSGWIIHGHHHNNDLRAFPFIDPNAKRINVSAEVIGYSPVSLKEICQTLRERVLPSGRPLLLRYPYID
ncbi:2'-5' RNA ligase family protein [Methanoregula sp.]|jgi:calcineurin-like phosphoesterase family protein|uniref:2'-5' RNA ligase family protein n=1 Tax=Methanoregula sp. TaxID=2052170 RepID=UPI003C1B4982